MTYEEKYQSSAAATTLVCELMVALVEAVYGTPIYRCPRCRSRWVYESEKDPWFSWDHVRVAARALCDDCEEEEAALDRRLAAISAQAPRQRYKMVS
jgi:hypothetical protein